MIGIIIAVDKEEEVFHVFYPQTKRLLSILLRSTGFLTPGICADHP